MKRVLCFMFLGAALAAAQSRMPVPDPGQVSLPLDEYNRLLELAGRKPKPVDEPPRPFALRTAAISIDVASGKATGHYELDGEVLAKGAVRVPLTTGLTVLEARQRGQELPLQQDSGVHAALLNGPSEFQIALQAGFALSFDAGKAGFQLPVPDAGVARLALVVPGDHATVGLAPGLITARSSSAGRTTIEATLVPGQPATVWWATREAAPAPAPKPARYLSDIRTLVSVGEGQMGLAALVDVTVLQGRPTQFVMPIPAGYEVTGAAGATLESSESAGRVLTLKLAASAQRSHQFLVTLERPAPAESKAEVPLLSVAGAQRETGEVLVEGEGTLELAAKESGALRRMDLKEVSPYLRALAHNTPQAAFRHHRQPSEPLGLALEWTRFPSRSLLPAVAEDAMATTMVTPEGKSLTEVKMHLRNSAQPFLRVVLPSGASIVSADVEGQSVKPVTGADGSRVPLLRPGFRPAGRYTVSFVYMDSGTPFAKKGGAEVLLPKMDVPIGLLRWEVFLPERYKVANFTGDAFSAMLLPVGERGGEPEEPAVELAAAFDRDLQPGELGGFVVDPSSAVIVNAEVVAESLTNGRKQQARTDAAGHWVVRGLPSGPVRITVNYPGFKSTTYRVEHDVNRPSTTNARLDVGSVSESVEVTAAAPLVMAQSKQIEKDLRQQAKRVQNTASANVLNLQKRVAGVLPIAVAVPRAGMSFRFLRPLVTDEPTRVAFTYKTR